MNAQLAVIRLLALFLIISTFTGINLAEASTNESAIESLEMDYIYMDGCPYCAQQQEMNNMLEAKYPQLEITSHNINDPHIESTIKSLEDDHNVEVGRIVAPMTFIEGNHFTGFNPSVEKEITSIVEDNLEEHVEREKREDSSEGSEKTYVPYFGETDLTGYSLIAITVLLGLIDGLNVCSIGALLLILGIVVKFDSRKKIVLYGGTFLLTTVIVYGGLIFLWYSLVESIMSYLGFVNILIGFAGILGGVYFFKEFLDFYKYGPRCKTTGNQHVSKFSSKVSDRLHDDSVGIVAIGSAIMLFAATITLVELPCSVALPVVFTGLLADASLTGLSYSLYILLYLLMYMLVELVIFIVALFTKDLWYGPDKAVTWTTLLASIIMLGLGFYYLPYIPIGM